MRRDHQARVNYQPLHSMLGVARTLARSDLDFELDRNGMSLGL